MATHSTARRSRSRPFPALATVKPSKSLRTAPPPFRFVSFGVAERLRQSIDSVGSLIADQFRWFHPLLSNFRQISHRKASRFESSPSDASQLLATLLCRSNKATRPAKVSPSVAFIIYASPSTPDHQASSSRLGTQNRAPLEHIRSLVFRRITPDLLKNGSAKSFSFCSPTPGIRRNSMAVVG